MSTKLLEELSRQEREDVPINECWQKLQVFIDKEQENLKKNDLLDIILGHLFALLDKRPTTPRRQSLLMAYIAEAFAIKGEDYEIIEPFYLDAIQTDMENTLPYLKLAKFLNECEKYLESQSMFQLCLTVNDSDSVKNSIDNSLSAWFAKYAAPVTSEPEPLDVLFLRVYNNLYFECYDDHVTLTAFMDNVETLNDKNLPFILLLISRLTHRFGRSINKWYGIWSYSLLLIVVAEVLKRNEENDAWSTYCSFGLFWLLQSVEQENLVPLILHARTKIQPQNSILLRGILDELIHRLIDFAGGESMVISSSVENNLDPIFNLYVSKFLKCSFLPGKDLAVKLLVLLSENKTLNIVSYEDGEFRLIEEDERMQVKLETAQKLSQAFNKIRMKTSKSQEDIDYSNQQQTQPKTKAICIPDTNYLLDHSSEIKASIYKKQCYFIIPMAVIKHLDFLKNGADSVVMANSRKVSNLLEKLIKNRNSYIHLQKPDEKQNTHIRLLKDEMKEKIKDCGESMEWFECINYFLHDSNYKNIQRVLILTEDDEIQEIVNSLAQGPNVVRSKVTNKM